MSKIIHQIWFQGEDNLPSGLLEPKESVINFNKDFEIKYWDYDKVASLVKNKRPEWIDKWNLVMEEDQAFVKLTEIARWLILYEYGGFYLDRDIIVYKPLNTLYNTLLPLQKVCMSSEKVVKDRYVQTPLGYVLYSVVNGKYESILQDSFVFTNPKNNFFNEFLEYAFTLRSKSVFESFSIWALTDFVQKFKKDIYLLDEREVLYGNDFNGYSHHLLFNGWVDEEADKPWKSTPSTLKNFNLYKI